MGGGATGLGAGSAATILDPKSLRFSSEDDTYLSRTFGTATNQNKWTFSMWVKRSKLYDGGYATLIGHKTAGNNYGYFSFSHNNDTYYMYSDAVPPPQFGTYTKREFRDTCGWMHICQIMDSAQASGDDRLRVWFNGQEATIANGQLYNYTQLTQNQSILFNTPVEHMIGKLQAGSLFSGYMADIWFLDGLSKLPTDFAEADSDTGQWIPKTYSGATTGTNTFHLDFSDAKDTTELGKDRSGNDNHWTLNNFSVASGLGNDSSTDSPYMTSSPGNNPRGTYCTLMPTGLNPRSGPVKQGGLVMTGNSNNPSGDHFRNTKGTVPLSSGKWYYEATAVGNVYGTTCPGNLAFVCGWAKANTLICAGANNFGDASCVYDNVLAYSNTGHLGNFNAPCSNSVGAPASGDVIGWALDLDASPPTYNLYKNGTSISSGNLNWTPTNNSPIVPWTQAYYTGDYWHFNFGQLDFSYSIPSGYKRITSQNFTGSSVGIGSTCFSETWYEGVNTSAANTVVVGFKPDLVISKVTSKTYMWNVFDTVRGANSRLSTNNTGTPTASNAYGWISAFNSDGYTTTAGSSNNENWNEDGETYISTAWKAGGNSNTFNVDGTGYGTFAATGLTSGDITPTGMSVGIPQGFSIIKYTGNGSNNQTLPHGLGQIPSLAIVKNLSSGIDWIVKHQAYTTKKIQYWQSDMGEDSATGSNHGIIDDFSNANTVNLTTNSSNYNNTNANGENYIMYVWADKPGYSCMGNYTGAGSEGQFIYTGFTPRYIQVKYTAGSGGNVSNWNTYYTNNNVASEVSVAGGNSNTGFNHRNFVMAQNLTNVALSSGSQCRCDFVSNGFYMHPDTNGQGNYNGWTYVFWAFAADPFIYGRGV